jgi:hypothetical protein
MDTFLVAARERLKFDSGKVASARLGPYMQLRIILIIEPEKISFNLYIANKTTILARIEPYVAYGRPDPAPR